MPDRVKIPESVPRLYRGVYQQIDEEQNHVSIARALIRAIKQDIRKSGQGGSTLIAQVAPVFSALCLRPMLPGIVDWVGELDKIDKRAAQIIGDPSHIEMGKAFRYDNPYLFSTKTQMCDAINDHTELAFNSISCDGRHRRADQSGQCGYCSSCLLRRVALLNTLNQDQTAYVSTCSHRVGQRSHALHFTAMHQQVIKLSEILKSTNPWLGIVQRYPDLRKLSGRLSQELETSESAIQNCLLDLYSNHVNEWMNVHDILQRSMTHSITPLQLQ